MNVHDTPYHDYIPLAVLLLLWSIVFVIAFVFYKFMSETNEIWAKPYFIGAISRADSKYVYVIRLIFETPPTNEYLTDSGLHIVLINNEKGKTLLNITVDDNRLKTYQPFSPEEPHKSIVRFLVHTNTGLQSINSVVLNLTSNKSLRIFNIEVQDIEDPESEANVAQVGIDVKRLKPLIAINEQSFPIVAKRFHEVEDSVTSSSLLNSFEYILFIWMTISLIAMFPTFLKICHNSPEIFYKHYNFSFISTFYTGLISSLCSSLIFVILISIYRYFIKYKLEKSFNSCFWRTLRYLYISIIICLGIISALIPITIEPNHDQIDEDPAYSAEPDLNIFWIVSVMIGISFYLFVWITILSIVANFLKFFNRTPVSKYETNVGTVVSLESVETPKNIPEIPKQVKRKGETDKPEEESENYFKELMKSNKNVASVSQYRGTPASSPKRSSIEVKTRSPIEDTKKPTEEVQAMDEENENYFKQFMKDGKIKSISHYKDLKPQQPSKKTTKDV